MPDKKAGPIQTSLMQLLNQLFGPSPNLSSDIQNWKYPNAVGANKNVMDALRWQGGMGDELAAMRERELNNWPFDMQHHTDIEIPAEKPKVNLRKPVKK